MTQALPIGNGNLGAMFFGGYTDEQIQFNEKTLWTGTPAKRGTFQNFGDVFISVSSHGASVSDYVRELSINDAMGSVSYTADGVFYRREYFASYPDELIVMRFTTPDDYGLLSLSVSLNSAQSGVERIADGNTIGFRGKLDTVSFEAALAVKNTGGTMASNSDKISVFGADEVTIFLAAATNYDNSRPGYIGVSEEILSQRLQTIIRCASQKSYGELKKNHIADYQSLFNRVTLDINQPEPSVPVNVLLTNIHNNSNYLEMLLFHYGRYLLISSSRGINLPNNLQGIWNNDNNPPWGSDIHSDINIQMNYWPAEVTNLSECHLPFINYITAEAMNPGGFWRKMANDEGHPGWVLAVENTIFGHSQWETNRPANAWYCMHLWQHYIYTLNTDFLLYTAWPVMKSACDYWLDRLNLASDGTWEAPDEWSPEIMSSNWRQSGVPHAQQLIWDLFHKTLEAANILGFDDCFTGELRDRFNNLDSGLHIGDWDNLKEWKYYHAEDNPNNTHRHISHLVGLFPGDLLTVHAAPEFLNAARVSLNARGDLGTGWARALKISMWARLRDGNRAHSLLKAAMSRTFVTAVNMSNDDGVLYDNLLCAHPPFQIDGNFGITAGIAEMLIQSHAGCIELLPALPDAWNSGSFTGLKAQGNFTVNLTWENSQPVNCAVFSGSGGTCFVRFGQSVITLQTTPGKWYTVTF